MSQIVFYNPYMIVRKVQSLNEVDKAKATGRTKGIGEGEYYSTISNFFLLIG